ncbi:MAG TPA: NAD-dependent epimerase/dehydratase [Drouetiella sp.]|jgi:nucleoside-diphosphate-sugar epimerase
MKRSAKILVTGASGFIGREVTRRLCRRGYEVHAVARSPGIIEDAIWHPVDLFDMSAVNGLLEEVRPSHLIHFAWVTEPGRFWNSPENHRWERATQDLFDSFANRGGKRFIGAGSCAEYEWTGKPCLETAAGGIPATLYGQAKLATFSWVEARALQCGVSSAWGRIFWLYGPHEHRQRLIPHVITGVLQRRPVDCSSGEQLRDFLHVDDVAEAFVRLLESDVKGAVNIASGNAVPVKEIISRIAQCLGGQQLIRFGAIPSNSSEPLVVCGDVSRLKEEVGFIPEISLATGLESTISWWKQQPGIKAVSV